MVIITIIINMETTETVTAAPITTIRFRINRIGYNSSNNNSNNNSNNVNSVDVHPVIKDRDVNMT